MDIEGRRKTIVTTSGSDNVWVNVIISIVATLILIALCGCCKYICCGSSKKSRKLKTHLFAAQVANSTLMCAILGVEDVEYVEQKREGRF